ncbi:MAG: aminomethyl-transferring glycine dehydrogenase subunit GcvPA [Armatimonadetes bacterium]|nr:aminomethyl-transferring glycine dehydrogenase subunit GcvPA [Armatimonadota bacterium]
MAYISNTAEDRAEMLAAMGFTSFQELLDPIPEAIRLKGDLNVPTALDEGGILRHLQELAAKNLDMESHLCFLGAGIYDHFRPTVVGMLAVRGEFATAYTPYQPELSQGMLQAIYEYQTLICAITNMDIANASMYDAATGLAEAALMATSLLNRSDILVSRAVNPHYRQVIETYAKVTGYRVVDAPISEGVTDSDALAQMVNDKTACVIFQQPNFFGNLEDVATMTNTAHRVGALAINSVDPIALGLLKPPGDDGVDIVVGEGQPLGTPMGYGGPLLGFFACNKRFVRSFPGRIVGATLDSEGRRGYTMTLRTREQDIRREKATSNICTNQALMALCATIYLCELGKSGLRQVADLSLQKAHYAVLELSKIEGVEPLFPKAKFFKEVAVKLPVDVMTLNKTLLQSKILGGLDLGAYYPEYAGASLLCVTETKTKGDIDRLVEATRSAIEGAN